MDKLLNDLFMTLLAVTQIIALFTTIYGIYLQSGIDDAFLDNSGKLLAFAMTVGPLMVFLLAGIYREVLKVRKQQEKS